MPPLRAMVALAVLGATLSAEAAPVEAVLFPSRPLQGDGARVYAMRLYLGDGAAAGAAVPSVRAAHGAVVGGAQPAGDGGFNLRYRPPRMKEPGADTLLVGWRGQSIPVEVRLEPAGRVQLSISVTPDPLLLQRGAEAEVHVRVRDAAGRPTRAPLRIGASIGKLTRAEEVEPGEYRATFTPPEDRFPQVAILAALSVADGAFAATALKLSARVPVLGEGEPGGTMQIAIDGKVFGPQPIAADGKFTIQVIVPPGGRAVGTSTDKLGNQQRREIDLQLPPFPRQIIAAVPNELSADGRARAEVAAFAVDARGVPERNRAPQLAAERGTLSAPQPRSDGAWTWDYTAPASGPGPVMLRTGSVQTRITLMPSPPFQLALVEPDEPLGAGGEPGDRQSVEVTLADLAGWPVSGARLSATLQGGRVAGIAEAKPGRYAISLEAPRDPGRGAAALHVELIGLRPGPPRRVTLHRARAPAGRVAAEAWVDDDLGLPVPDAPVELSGPEGTVRSVSDRYGTARIEFATPTARRFVVTAEAAQLPGLVAALDCLQVGGTLRAVSSVSGRGILEIAEAPPGATLDADLPLRPAAPIDLRVTAEPSQLQRGQSARVQVLLRGPGGRSVDGAIVYQATGGRIDLVQAVKDGRAELRFTPPADARPGARYLLSVTETRTRVTVFTELVVVK